MNDEDFTARYRQKLFAETKENDMTEKETNKEKCPFKLGDLVCHKASLERAVVTKVGGYERTGAVDIARNFNSDPIEVKTYLLATIPEQRPPAIEIKLPPA